MDDFLPIALYALTAFLWGWALVDLSRSRSSKGLVRFLWLLVIILFPVLGSIFYFQFGRTIFLREERKFNPKFKRIEH